LYFNNNLKFDILQVDNFTGKKITAARLFHWRDKKFKAKKQGINPSTQNKLRSKTYERIFGEK